MTNSYNGHCFQISQENLDNYDAKDVEFCRKVVLDLRENRCWASSDAERQVVDNLIARNEALADAIETHLLHKSVR